MWDIFTSQLANLRQGGWLLVLLGLLALVLYATLAAVATHVRRQKFLELPRERWRALMRQPHTADAPLQYLLRYIRTHGQDLPAIRRTMKEVRTEHLAYMEGRLVFLVVLTSAAPLTGLLGTVVGMLKTFSGLSRSSGASPIEMISSGISQALVTTQAGLIIAIPAAMATAFLLKRRNQIADSLTQLESALCCELHLGDKEPEPVRGKT